MSYYISLDLETTGLDPDNAQIIQIGAVLDDLESPIAELPKLELLVLNEDRHYGGDIRALTMNAEILKSIDGIHEYIEDDEEPPFPSIPDYCFDYQLPIVFAEWVSGYSKDRTHVYAGKNFSSFDYVFLDHIDFWEENKCKHRSLDLGSIYWNPALDGVLPPNLQTCKERAGIIGPVQHTALADAIDVVQCIRRKF